MKKVAVLLATGYEEIEALTVVDVMRRAGEECHIVSTEDIEVVSSHNIKVTADKILEDKLEDYDLVVLPGGLPGATNLQKNPKVIEVLRDFNNKGKLIAAMCAAPIVLATAGVIEGKNITSYPGYEEELQGANYIDNENVVVDGNLITSRGPATTLPFAYKMLEVLGNDAYKTLQEGMMFNFLMR